MMISYYLFMGLLCLTLVLWAIIAIRDDGTPPDRAEGAGGPKEPSGGPAAGGQSLRQSEKK